MHLLTCKICKKQYVGSTITKFRLRFDRYKSNINLYGEGRRNFEQQKLIKYFCRENYNGTHQDISVKIFGICARNDQEKQENFWMNKLRTLYPEVLNYKRINQY